MIRLITVFTVFGLIAATSSYAGGGTSANSAPGGLSEFRNGLQDFDYAVLPFDHYQEEGLPPVLRVTFQLKCFQEFVKVIRHEDTEPVTGKITIAVGLLVKEDLLSPCESAQDV